MTRQTDIILLTATIAPPSDARCLARTDVAARIADYRRAFDFYLEKLAAGDFERLLFVDNSNYPEPIFERRIDESGLADRIELISFDGLNADPQTTRLFGECNLLRHAFENSTTIAAYPDARVWKATGRYIVRNLGVILRRSPADCDFYCHCRNSPFPFVDFGLAGFSARRAGEVIDVMLSHPDMPVSDEALLRRMIEGGAFDGFKVSRRFPAVPDFSGIRGSDNASYDGLAYRAKFYLRVLANRIAPGLWL